VDMQLNVINVHDWTRFLHFPVPLWLMLCLVAG